MASHHQAIPLLITFFFSPHLIPILMRLSQYYLYITIMISTMSLYVKAFIPRMVPSSIKFSKHHNVHRLVNKASISTTRMVMSKDDLDVEISKIVDDIIIEEISPPTPTTFKLDMKVRTSLDGWWVPGEQSISISIYSNIVPYVVIVHYVTPIASFPPNKTPL